LNIVQARKELRIWGKFWRSREELQGYSSKSTTARLMEIGRTGIWASSDKHLHSHGSDGIRVPDWVERLDKAIAQLPVQERCIVSYHYIKGRQLTRSGRRVEVMAVNRICGLI
jgi:hypothetical protein